MEPNPGTENPGTDLTVNIFYRVARAGAERLSDGGGPFGFDIAVAMLVDDLIRGYGCDAIAETGCFLGDTALYLARRYPDLPVYTCDIDPTAARFTERRLKDYPNATVACQDSPRMLEQVTANHSRVLAFLDAHWGDRWPLATELDIVADASGVSVVHDFDIGHQRFSFDTYAGVPCGPDILAQMRQPPAGYYVLNPEAELPVPCLQVGRRAGTAVVCPGEVTAPADECAYLSRRPLNGGENQ